MTPVSNWNSAQEESDDVKADETRQGEWEKFKRDYHWFDC